MINLEQSNYNHRVQKKNKYILFIWILIITLLMYGHMINSSSIRLISLLIGTIIYIRVKGEFKFYLLLFSLPFINFLRIGSENFSFLNIWTVFLFINLLLYKPKVHRFNILVFISFILIITINISNMGWSAYIGSLLNIFLVFMVCLVEYENRFKVRLMNASIFISLGFIMSSILGFIMRIISPNQLGAIKVFSAIPGEISLRTTRFTGLMVDPNYYAQGILICIACVFVCIIKLILDKNAMLNKKKLILTLMLLLIIMILFGLYSYSKMFIIITSLILLSFTMYIFIIRKNIVIKFLLIFMIIGIIILSLDSIGLILDRFTGGGDMTTGRLAIFNKTINLLIENSILNLLIGIGIGGTLAIKTFGSAVHNMYLEYISSIGIIGTSIWGLLLYRAVKSNNKFNLIDMYKYLPLFTILITGIALDALWAKWHYFYIILAILSIKSIYTPRFRKE